MSINPVDTVYHNLLDQIITDGVYRPDRTGTGTKSLFQAQMTFDLKNQALPLITTKRVHLKSVIHELLWIISGDTNVRYLQENGVKIWNEWADENGDLGPIYGKQWRDYQGPDGERVDQLTDLIEGLRADPYSRRHILTAWNPAQIRQMHLPPCHSTVLQCYVRPGASDKARMILDMAMYQRSADAFLGVPLNIASYGMLAHMIAHELGYEAGKLTWLGGDVHIYSNHYDQVREQLARTSYKPTARIVFSCTKLRVTSQSYGDFVIRDYESHPSIKAPVAV